MNRLIEFREDEGAFADERIIVMPEQLAEEYDNLPAGEKLEWWIEYLGKDKVYEFIVDTIFDNEDEKYDAEMMIEELENVYDKDEMIGWKWRSENGR